MSLIEKHSKRIHDIVTGPDAGLCFGYITENAKGTAVVDGFIDQPCHGNLNGRRLSAEKGLFYTKLSHTAINHRYRNRGFNKVWLEYLLSDESPYRKLTAGRERMIFAEEKFPEGIALEVHHEDDMILLCNFAIAIRAPFETPESLSFAESLLERGDVDNIGEAFFLGSNFCVSDISNTSAKDDLKVDLNVGGHLGCGHSIFPGYGSQVFDLFKWTKGETVAPVEKTLGKAASQWGIITRKFSHTRKVVNGKIMYLDLKTQFVNDLKDRAKKPEGLKTRWAIPQYTNNSKTVRLSDITSVWRDKLRGEYQKFLVDNYSPAN